MRPGKADATLVINKMVKQTITEAKVDYIWKKNILNKSSHIGQEYYDKSSSETIV